MAATELDRPNLMVFPPLLLLATIALATVLQWSWPLGALGSLDQQWRIPVGSALILLGVVLTALGGRALVQRGTNVNPLLPALALATDGIFRWTRLSARGKTTGCWTSSTMRTSRRPTPS